MTDEAPGHPGLDQVKQRQRAMWGEADYAGVGARIPVVSELLCEAVDLQGGERVLDVACGNGNAALAAARRFAEVTGVDYQPRLLERARRRAAAEGLEVDFREGDAEALDFEDESFDVVLSACGAMFAPDQERTAAELRRVCRRGGRIGMVNWTPTSWVAELGRTVARYVPPPAGVRPPVEWGDPARLRELLGADVDLQAPRRTFSFRFPSVQAHVQYFCENYPPIAVALDALDEEEGERLRADIADLAARFDSAPGDSVVLPLEYLEVVARKP